MMKETHTGTTLTLKNENGTYTIHVDEEAMTIWEMANQLVAPILCAAGYTDDTVAKVIIRD